MMDEKEEFDKIFKEIEKKLEKNPQLREEMQKSILKIEEILGHQIEVSVVYTKGMDEWMRKFSEYTLGEVNSDVDLSEVMTLGEFISFVKDEEHNLKVSIDPLYLKEGINEITNVLTTSLDDKVIIVPKSLEK